MCDDRLLHLYWCHIYQFVKKKTDDMLKNTNLSKIVITYFFGLLEQKDAIINSTGKWSYSLASPPMSIIGGEPCDFLFHCLYAIVNNCDIKSIACNVYKIYNSGRPPRLSLAGRLKQAVGISINALENNAEHVIRYIFSLFCGRVLIVILSDVN